MEKITAEQFQQLTSQAKILEQDPYGPKVLETSDNKIIKLFRLKRKLSSALFRPYAVRFAANARRLARLGIPALAIDRIVYCPSQKRHLVVYPKLPGEPLRTCLLNEEYKGMLLELARFIASLHQQGIYFRSLHLGNILALPGGGLGLIDFADMQFLRAPLSPNRRARNFHHLLRYSEDRKMLEQAGMDEFIREYLDHAGMSGNRLRQFHQQQQRINHISPVS